VLVKPQQVFISDSRFTTARLSTSAIKTAFLETTTWFQFSSLLAAKAVRLDHISQVASKGFLVEKRCGLLK